jgi:malate dehydrogenase
MISIAKLSREEMIERVKNSGTYIIRAKGATVFGPGDAIATLIRTIVEEENRMLSVSAQIEQETLGYEGVCISVPAKITRGDALPIGVRLSVTEAALFDESVKVIKNLTDRICTALDAESRQIA